MTAPIALRSEDLQLAGAFLVADGVTMNGIWVHPRSLGVMLNDNDYTSLRNVFSMLDDNRDRQVRVVKHPTENEPREVILAVEGDYRGMRATAQTNVSEHAALDLIQSFVDDNGTPNVHLLDALAAPVPAVA